MDSSDSSMIMVFFMVSNVCGTNPISPSPAIFLKKKKKKKKKKTHKTVILNT